MLRTTAAFLLCGIGVLAGADISKIRYLFESMLNEPAGTAPKLEDLAPQLTSVTTELTSSEVELLLPLAQRSLRSQAPEVRHAGIMLLLAAVLRSDSSRLLEPYIDDLAAIVNTPGNPLRNGALYILGSMNPSPSAKAIATLSAHLDDKGNSPQELTTIVASLLVARASDAAVVHRILEILDRQTDPGLKNMVIRQLGLTRTRNTEALTFIGKGLDSDDKYVRASAIDATDRLDADLRIRFIPQLRRIAADRGESEENRSHAEAVLRK